MLRSRLRGKSGRKGSAKDQVFAWVLRPPYFAVSSTWIRRLRKKTFSGLFPWMVWT